MTQMDRLARIREEWKAKQQAQPDLECDHPHLSQEYYLGAQTGDWCCTQCGESMPPSEWKKLGKKFTKDWVQLDSRLAVAPPRSCLSSLKLMSLPRLGWSSETGPIRLFE